MTENFINRFPFARRAANVLIASGLLFVLFFGISVPLPFVSGGDGKTSAVNFSLVTPAAATNTYYNFSSGNLSLTLSAATANLITSNDQWTNIPSVEGYKGTGLTSGFPNVYGVNPQSVTATEFASNSLPSGNTTQIQANKGNPNAVNNGGIAEFDSGPYICFGFQGNVQSNPYMVFYVNTTGYTNIKMSYKVQDIDSGSNDSVSQISLQYRVGNTGAFIDVPDGFIADATDPASVQTGRITTRSVTLPAAVNNQPMVQVRIITTDAADSTGSSTPDEWIGVNNIVLGPFGPTAAGATVGGRVYSPSGRPLANTQVLMYDNTGGVRTAISNAFGYYRFEGVPVGQTYIFEIRSKRYVFSEPVRTLSVQEDFDSLDFYSDSASLLNLKSNVLESKY
jgi:hypothetical protein